MPTQVTPTSNGFTISMDSSGNFDGSFTVNADAGLNALNWAGLIQWITTYGPSLMTAIMALIAVFGGPPGPSPTPAPVPTPTPIPQPPSPHEAKL